MRLKQMDEESDGVMTPDLEAQLVTEQRFTDRNLGELTRFLVDINENARDFVCSGGAFYVKGGKDIDATIVTDDTPGWHSAIQNLDAAFGEDMSLSMTKWAAYQLCEKTGVPWRYLKAMEEHQLSDLIAKNFNSWLLNRKKPVLVRSVGSTVRAVLGPQYRVIGNLELLTYISMALNNEDPEKGAIGINVERRDAGMAQIKVKDIIISETRFHIRLIDHERSFSLPGDNGIHRPGLVLSNTEVGDGAMVLAPELTTMVYMNGMIIQEKIMREVHVGKKLDPGIYRPETLTAASIATYMEVGDLVQHILRSDKIFLDYMESLKAATETKFTKPLVHVVDDINMNLKLSLSEFEIDSIISKLGSDDTLPAAFRNTPYAVTQALTAVARDSNSYRMMFLEKAAGAYIKQFTPKLAPAIEVANA
jgi:hypothetical protein